MQSAPNRLRYSVLPLFVMFTAGCDLFGSDDSEDRGGEVDSGDPYSLPWSGLGPMTLSAGGGSVQETVSATGGYVRESDDAPAIVVVLGAGAATSTLPDGFRFVNLGIDFETGPDAVISAWDAGNNLPTTPVELRMLLASESSTRLVGSGATGCTVGMNAIEALPESILTGDQFYRYGIELSCTDVPYEDVPDDTEGVYSTLTATFDGLVGIINPR